MNNSKHIKQITVIATVAALAATVLTSGCCSKKSKPTAYYSTHHAAYAQTAPPAQAQPQATATASGDLVIPLYQESVNVGKREVDAGSVRLRKIVKTETVNQPVEIRHEEVVIDRLPPGAESPKGQSFGQPFQEQETVIKLQNEVPMFEKQMTPAGNVVVQRRQTASQTNFQTQIRREDVDIAKIGNPQNVTLGSNLQFSSETETAVGAGGEVGGQGKGGATSPSGSAINDPMMLFSSPDSAALNGRTVKFTGVRVQSLPGDQVVELATDKGQPIYVKLSQPAPDLKAGDTINLTGTIKQTPASPTELGLSEEAAQKLKGQPLYIDSGKIESPNQ